MFNQLETEHSLYIIRQEHLQQFKQLVENWKTVLHDVDPKCLNKKDTWAVVMNSWIFLKSHHNNLIIHPSKAIHYSINTFLIEELRKAQIIQKILANNDDDLFYITAFQLVKDIDLWLYNLLNTNDHADILQRSTHQEYFLAHNNNAFTASNAIFQMDQTRTVKIVAQAIRTKNCFWLTVHNAAHQALHIYHTHFLKEHMH